MYHKTKTHLKWPWNGQPASPSQPVLEVRTGRAEREHLPVGVDCIIPLTYPPPQGSALLQNGKASCPELILPEGTILIWSVSLYAWTLKQTVPALLTYDCSACMTSCLPKRTLFSLKKVSLLLGPREQQPSFHTQPVTCDL